MLPVDDSAEERAPQLRYSMYKSGSFT